MKDRVIHAYVGCNITAVQKQLTGIVTLMKKMLRKEHLKLTLHIALIKLYYAQEIMMSTITVKKFITVLTEILKFCIGLL
jgi:hypothetical protein